MGINVKPLMAVGGVSGIAIGFGAQSVSANAITGINLVSHADVCFTGRHVAGRCPQPVVQLHSSVQHSAGKGVQEGPAICCSP